MAEKTTARKTLEAMQTALLELSTGAYTSASFNGQSFTRANLRELQDAIDRQQAIVNREERTLGSGKLTGIGIRFGRGVS